MKLVALKFTYHTDLIEVPDIIEKDIKLIQRKFDKWLYNKDIDHSCWTIRDGKKIAVSFDSQDFVDFINNLFSDFSTAKIVKHNIDNIPDNISILYF